ncbi:hypothetical protein CPB85DRAFT_1536275 [Mucidula mucida]|nr:hypothetical protein CPB85DRAFT_1536275 [Mucidula mucida]
MATVNLSAYRGRVASKFVPIKRIAAQDGVSGPMLCAVFSIKLSYECRTKRIRGRKASSCTRDIAMPPNFSYMGKVWLGIFIKNTERAISTIKWRLGTITPLRRNGGCRHGALWRSKIPTRVEQLHYWRYLMCVKSMRYEVWQNDKLQQQIKWMDKRVLLTVGLPRFYHAMPQCRLTRLKAVTFTEALTFRGPLSKMLLEDLPRLSSVRTVKLQYVKGLFVEDVAHILSAFQDMSVLEIWRCNIVRDRDSSVVPPVPVALETLSLLHAQSFITEILAGSVAPPMISFHKLRRLIVAGAIMQRIWPSYEDLFLQIQGTVKEVILYTGPEVVPAKARLARFGEVGTRLELENRSTSLLVQSS